MFRSEQAFELTNPVLRALSPDVRQFHLVEQVFEVPLWSARVLPVRTADAGGDDRFWSRYLATRPDVILGVIAGKQWERAVLHVVLPGYMTKDGTLSLARCSALWEACSHSDEQHFTWLFETDLGSFVDPQYGVELNVSRKLDLRWRDAEGSSA